MRPPSPDPEPGGGFLRDRERRQRRQRLFLGRILVLSLACLLLFAILAARVSYLTLWKGEQFREQAQENFLRSEPIPCPRGVIADRYGRLLATSETRFDLTLSRFRLSSPTLAATLDEVRRLCPPARQQETTEIFEALPSRHSWREVELARNLTLEQAAPLMERLGTLPGLRVEQTFLRIYPYGRDASQITGYVGRIGPKQLDQYLEQGYSRNDIVGIHGLEKKYEARLRGVKGSKLVRRNARGRLLDWRVQEKAVEGSRLNLTYDIDLQTSVTRLLEGRPGSIVALDPRNGAILAMASYPDYDPNNPVILPGSGDSLRCKAYQEHYAPGSTFKLVTAAAALINGHDPMRRIHCSGRLEGIPGFAPRCDARWGHGFLDLREAIKKSCNVYFFELAREMSADHLVATASRFGFGRPTGVDLSDSGESRGVLGIGQRRPYLGDRVFMGIGQGRMISVTPLQLCLAFAALANGGVVYRPRAVDSALRPDGFLDPFPPVQAGQIPWQPWQREVILRGMRDVVEDRRSGTGRHAEFDPAMRVAGKTGSAERYVGGERGVDAWFACFAPWDAPEICVTVLIEQSGHGGEVAAPVARKVLEAYFRLQQKRRAKLPGADQLVIDED